MPRRRRIFLPGAPVHVVQRGHNRAACFFQTGDYLLYKTWLGDALQKTGCALHAYVLMTNHVHLLLTPPTAQAVPLLFISLGRRYVQYINKRYRRTGTLWDSRYKASLVHAETYLFNCYRYIELNPVRAGMTADPAHYRWSSYRANALGQPDSLLSMHPSYQQLGTCDAVRQATYRRFFGTSLAQQVIDDIRLGLNQGQPLGDALFLDEIEAAAGQRREVRVRGRPPKDKARFVH